MAKESFTKNKQNLFRVPMKGLRERLTKPFCMKCCAMWSRNMDFTKGRRKKIRKVEYVDMKKNEKKNQMDKEDV